MPRYRAKPICPIPVGLSTALVVRSIPVGRPYRWVRQRPLFHFPCDFRTWVLNPFFGTDRKSSTFGVWGPGGPDGAEPPFNRRAAKQSAGLKWFCGPSGPPGPPKSTIPGRPRNHALKSQGSRSLADIHTIQGFFSKSDLGVQTASSRR